MQNCTNPKISRKEIWFSLQKPWKSLMSIIIVLLCTFSAGAATHTVTNTNASGSGSFHAAVLASAAGDIIDFNFSSGSAPWVIHETSQENITVANLTIKGNTASGYSGVPLIQIDGNNALNYCFDVTASGFTVIGLSITQYASAGIYVENKNCTVQNCYIGVKPDGTTFAGVFCAVWAFGVSGLTVDGETFGHNVFTTTDYPGVYFQDNSVGCSNATITGTYIGTNAAGTSALGSIGYGVYMDFKSSNISVGGATAAKRNVICHCNNFGLHFGGSGNSSKGNYIGIGSDGTTAIGNLYGVYSEGSSNFLGGTAAGEGNVISGNTQYGLFMDGFSNSANETIQGNIIGLNAAGTAAVANQAGGIYIQGIVSGTSNGHVIGGTTTAARNIISGNTGVAIYMSQTKGTVIQGNYIGLNAAGTAKIANSFEGIYIDLNSSGTQVGGSTAAAGNVISGNGSVGVHIQGNSNTIQNNYIGLDPTGTAGLGNSSSGITIDAATGGKLNTVSNNVISGNTQDGITLNGTIAANNTITGNTIGLNAAGTAKIANGANGITLKSTTNTIGGTTAAARNIISGNTKYGIQVISNGGSTIAGNYIGLNAAGTAALGNATNGIGLTGTGSTIGGSTSASRNIISGNTGIGIEIVSGTYTVQNNYIGLNAAGTAAVGNTQEGIKISSSTANTIGLTSSNSGANTISGNGANGIFIAVGSHTIGVNYIGVNGAQTAAIGNGFDGILVSTNGNTIGGSTSSISSIISGNSKNGIEITGNTNTVVNCIVGTDAGTTALPNTLNGLLISGQSNTIGGTTFTLANLFSGNTLNGISISGAGAKNNIVIGNFIGLNSGTLNAAANGGDGISISSSASGNTIGGTSAGNANYIAGNTGNGVNLASGANFVIGNYIGLNSSFAAKANGLSGVNISSASNTIGGTSAGSPNVISGNTKAGVTITGASATSNTIAGNLIGANNTGTAATANGTDGILITSSAGSNTIGGSTTASRNIISGNTGYGVNAGGSGSNVINNNYIGTDVTGASAIPNGIAGISLTSNSNTIGGTNGNLISGNTNIGISVSGNNNIIKGNWLGINATGATALSNNNTPDISFLSGTGNTVGGSSATDRNIISGSGSAAGILINASGQTIENNYIGTNSVGSAAIPNTQGISVNAGSNNIGVAGAGNLISGNSSDGILLATGSSNNVQGNVIGLGAGGTFALPNGANGISIAAASNTIGGTASGAGNTISANTNAGIAVTSASNTIQGNSIGTNIPGNFAFPNNTGGIIITGAANNTIGGNTTGAGNVISGNKFNGLTITGAGANNTLIQGNTIGLNASGTGALPNIVDGILISNSASGATIGGVTTADRNIISGNGSFGIEVQSGSNTIQGNYIGLDGSGTSAFGNTSDGVRITASASNVIGGSVAGSGNVISGNTENGVLLFSSATHTVRGNYIGTDAAGTTGLGNGFSGISLQGAATGDILAGNVLSANGQYGILILNGTHIITGNYIGIDAAGTSAMGNGSIYAGIGNFAGNSIIGGTTAADRNVISGNAPYGIRVAAGSPIITGNYIGTNASGTSALPNSYGILISTTGVTIGGSTAGAGNLISGNTSDGISVGASNTIIKGNYIGLNAAGTGAIANQNNGISITVGAFNTIGGAAAADGNFISGNGQDGINIAGTGANTLQHNYIGTNVGGTSAVANGGDGIDMTTTANDVVDNVISGNIAIGVHMSTGGISNTVHRNIVGLNAAGNAAIANQNSGIWDDGGNNIIGGSTASEGNVSSGNSNYGIVINTAASFSSGVRFNMVGTDATGTSAIANGKSGVELRRTGNSLKNNTISYNTGAGVLVSAGSNDIVGNNITGNGGKGITATSGTGILISQNSISGNSFGIDLGNNGVTTNDAGDADAGANNLQNFPVITSVVIGGGNTTVKGTLNSAAATTYTIEVYENTAVDPSGYGQGKNVIGSVSTTTDASGNANFTLVSAGSHHLLTAIAIDPSNNTSEFALTTAPEIAVSYNSVDIADGSTTPPVFDSTYIGNPITRTYKIDNLGTEDLNLSSLSLPSGFSVVGSLPTTIVGGSSADLKIKLDATANGTYSGTLSFVTDDGNENPFDFKIFGWVGCWNTVYADPAGNDANTGSASNLAKKTVQAAIDAACDGATVYLTAADYNESASVVGKSIKFGITTLTATPLKINSLSINASSDSVTLLAPLTIDNGTLTLVHGKLKTSTSAYLLMDGNSANISGGSTTEYIDGPVKFSLYGTQTNTMTVPLGKGSTFRPLSLTVDLTDGASAGNTFEFQLFNNDPHALSLTIPSGKTVSKLRYYQVDHTVSNGTVNSANIILPFRNDGSNDGVSDLSNLYVFKGNGSGAWTNLGGTASGTLSGSYYNGSITSGNFTTFSPFVLAFGCGLNPQPVVDFTYSNTCVNSVASFTNTSTISAGNILSYTWDFGDGSAQVAQAGVYPPNPAAVTHTYTTAGTYTVSLQAISDFACQVVLSKYITISPNPQATITHVDNEVCFGSNPEVIFNVSNVATTDNWTLNYSTTNPASNVNVNGTGSGSFTFTTAGLTGPSSNIILNTITNTTTGCSNSTLPTKTITVDPATVAGTLSGTATVCSGSNSGTVTASGGTGNIIRWESSVDGGVTWTQISNTAASQAYTNITTTTMFRAIYQSGTCNTAAATAVTITVNPLPTASINAGTSICAGTTANLTLTVANTGGANWTIGYTEGTTATTISGTGNGSFVLTTGTLNSNTSVTLNSIALTSGSPLCSNTLNSVSNVTINPKPTATVTLNNSTICFGSNPSFTLGISNVAAGQNWSVTYTTTNPATTVTTTGTGSGNFTITTASLTGPSSNITITALSNTTTGCANATLPSAVTVTVTPATVAGTTSGTATVCSGSNSGLVKLAGNTGNVVKWQYSTDGGTTFTDIANTSTNQSYTNITATTIYQAIVQNGVCAAATSTATTITVNPLPTATIGGGTTICSGNTANLTVTIANVSGVQFWTLTYLEGSTTQTLSNKGPGNFTLTTSTLSATTSYTLQSIVITSGAPTCSNSLLSGNTSATVTVNPLPSATIGSGSTICAGSTATISVNVSDVSSTDAWTLSYTEGATAKTLSGTGPGNFTITTSALAGNTTVTFTSIKNNTTSCTQAESGSATITVNPATVAGTTSGAANVCSGVNSGNITLSSNTGSIVKWQSSTDGGTTWNDIANTTATQGYSNITITTQYRAVVQSGVCAAANSSVTTITVNPSPVASISGSTTICSGTTANLTVTVSNVGAAQNWSIAYIEGATNKTLTGTGNGSFTLTTATLSSATTYELLSITETSGSPACANTSLSGATVATVTVNPLPSATIGSGSTICAGSTATIQVNVSNVSSTDAWTLSYNEGATAKTISGTGPGNYTITTGALAGNTTVTLTSIKNNTTTCTQAESGSATITVTPATVAGTTSGTATVCSGNNSGVVKLAGNTGSVVKWQYSTDGGTTWTDIANTTTSQNYTNITATTIYQAVVQNGVCAAATSTATTITVNPLPTATIGGGTTICAGTTANLTVTVANVNGSQLWTLTYLEGSTTQTLSNKGPGNFTLTTSALSATTSYTLQSIVITSGAPTCSNSALTGNTSATVTVNPLPSATIGSGSTICNGSTATIAVTVSGVSSTDAWTLSYTEGATAKTISGTGPGSYTITTSALAGNTTVTLTSVKNNTTTCTQALSGSATITVSPATVAGTTSGTATVCYGSNSGVVKLAGNTGSVVKWQYSTDGGTTWTDIANTTTSQNYTNITATTMYQAVVQSGVCAATASTTTTITVNPLPTVSISGSTTVCSGTTANLTVTVANVAVGQTWTLSYLEGVSSKTLSSTGSGSFTLTTSTLSATTDYTLQSIAESGGAVNCTNSSLTGTVDATVKVNPLPTATISSPSTTICSGSTASFTLNIGSVPAADNWSVTYTTTNPASTNTVTGTGSGSFAVTTPALSGGASSVIKLTNISNTSTTCSTVPSASATVTISPTTVPGTTSGAATVCYASNSGTVKLAGNTGSVVKWQYSTDGGTTWADIANTTTSQNYTNLTATTIYQAVVQSGVCPATASTTTTITVNPLPTVIISGGTTICSGSTANLTVTTSNTNGATWTLSYMEGTSGKTMGGTGNGNFTLTTSALTSNTDITLQGISLITGSPQCSNNNLTGVITQTVVVNPLPIASISGSQTICSGSAPAFSVSINNVPTGQTWKLSYTEGATAKTLTGTGSGTFAMNTATATNVSASNTTVTYTLTSIVNTGTVLNCTSSTFGSGTYTVTVNPATNPGVLSGTTTYCGTVNSGSITLGGYVGAVVRWEYSTDGGTTWTNLASTSPSQSYNNLAVTTIYRVLVQSGVCGAFYSTQATVTVNPQPSASISGSQTICSGSTPAITVTVTNVPAGQNWSLAYNEGATAKTLTGTGSGTFALNASALTNSTGSQTSVTYALSTITNTSLSCASPTLTSTYKVSIDPVTAGGTLSTGSAAVCSGTNSGTLSLSGQTGAIVRWEFSTDAGATWIYVANTTNSLSFNNLTATRQYRVLVQSGVCAQAYSSTQTITVNPLPVATIAGNNSVCTNSTSVITFTVSNVAATDNWTINYTVNATAQTFTGTGPGSFTYTTPVMTYPPNNVVYSLVSISNGKTGCSNSASGTATIQVNPKPVVSYTSTDVCFGLPMTFANKSSIPAGNITGYRWDFGDGSISTDINPVYTYAAAGTYNVKLVVSTQYGCKDSITKAVTVFPKPTATFTTGNTCESDSALFISTSTISSGTITGTSWDFGDGGTSALVKPKHKYDFTGTFNVIMNVVSDKGCTNSTSQRVTVYPLPTANFSAEAVCEYDSMQFVNLSDIPYGKLTYSWTFEPGKTSTAKEPKYRFSGPGNFFVKLVTTSNWGCKDSVVRMITIDPKPDASFSFKDVCIGNENVFTNKSSVKTGVIDNVFWNFGDSTYASGDVVRHTYKVPGKYNVTLMTKTGKGCLDTTVQVVTVHALPSAKITPSGPIAFCDGLSVDLSAPSGLTYAWSTGETTQTIKVTKSGTYKVVVTEAFGCTNTDSIKIIVYPLPIANAGKDTTISKGFTALLHGNGGVTYHWAPPSDLDNADIQTPTARPLQTTSFTLTVIDIHGCSSSDTVIVNVIDDHKVITYNTISPNGDGMNDEWVIDNLTTFPGATVTIYNRYGQIMYQTDDYKNDWKGTFNGQDLPEGTYYYTITFKDNEKVYKGPINIVRNTK